jgi:hypothetical protein
MKVKHVEEGSTSDIYVEIVNQIYNQRFQQYMDYCWIKKSIVQNATSRSFKRVRDQLNHINHSYTFLPTTCTTTKNC